MGSFQLFDEVLLLRDDAVVALGRVVKILSTDICEKVFLGMDRLGVLIESVVDEEMVFPYSPSVFENMGQALDSVVMWPRRDTKLVSNLSMDSQQSDSDDCEMILPPVPPVSISRELDGVETVSTPSAFVQGDIVSLLSDGIVVGEGSVFSTSPDGMCHNSIIGIGNISITVLKCNQGNENFLLPFPHVGADTLSECIGTFAVWRVLDVRKVSVPIEMQGGSLQSARIISTNDKGKGHFVVDCEETPDISQKRKPLTAAEKGKGHAAVKDFTQRKDWTAELVEVFCLDRETILAKGRITVAASLGVVNDQILGDANVGVTLVECFGTVYFTAFQPGVPCLVSWPIRCVRLVEDGRFLGDIIDQGVPNTVDAIGPLELSYEPVKRPYNFDKRKKADPEARRVADFQKKAATMITPEAIDAVKRIKCCSKNCCERMPSKHIAEVRMDFQGSCTVDKSTYILSLFDSRPQHVISKGLMVLKTLIICKKAFHGILGFSKGQFYVYKAQHESGAKIGFHGNKGLPKPRGNTEVAHALLGGILAQTAEPMPHNVYNGYHGTGGIEYRLPSCFTRSSIFEELCSKMTAENLPLVSSSTFYNIWNTHFENFKVHSTSAFSKCDLCSLFKEQLHKEKRREPRAHIERQREAHLREQMSRRQCYYGAKILSKVEPETYLCIIHDKMDQAKTWLPKVGYNPKALNNAGHPMPVSLTGMLTHGHLPGAFAHLSLTGVWPGDSDFTVTSLAKCFRDLEDFSGDISGDISVDPFQSKHSIHEAVMDSSAFRSGYLEPKNISLEMFKGNENQSPTMEDSSEIIFNPLPRHLTLQMDNSGKDNKNQIVMAFCSDLVSRGVFETVTMSFLMVGHTHEDVDALFSKIALQIRGREVATVRAMMTEVWLCQEVHPVPSLITEVADYKGYLESFHMNFDIIGQSFPVAFLFSMRNNVPIYQYKARQSDTWIPVNGRCIWTTDASTKLKILPFGDPPAKRMTDATYTKAAEVVPYLRRYCAYLARTCPDPSSEAYRQRSPLIAYWERIADILDGQIRPVYDENIVEPLSTRFWPRTNHGTGFKSDFGSSVEDGLPQNSDLIILQDEFDGEMEDREELFVGRRSEKEKQRWTPLQEIKVDNFILLRPEEAWEAEHGKGHHFWLVKALSVVDENHVTEEGPRAMFLIEWWRPKHVKETVSDKHRYLKCFALTQSWERDPGFSASQEIWQMASSALYGWTSKMDPANIMSRGLKIPKSVLDNVKASLKRILDEAN